MDEAQSTPDEKIIEVEAPNTRKETRSLLTSLVIFAAIVGIAAFVIGLGIGSFYLSASSTQTPSSASPSASIEGGKVYVDKENLFAISYPKGWEAKKHDDSGYEGVRIGSDKGYVDLWLLVDQPFFLGEKHQKAIKGDEEVTAEIDGKTASGVQYNYKAGNFFTVLVLPDTPNTPQVSFWLEADDEKTKEETQSIAESFIFLNK